MTNLTEVFRRVIQPTTSMKVTITYKSDGQLSLVGSGRHGAGQVSECLTKDNPAHGFTRKDCFRLKQVWNRWHLNHLRSGTPKQEEAVRSWRPTVDDPSYEGACKMLESIDLLTDNGYRYGTSWLKEEVPLDVLEWLFKLPGTGNTFMEVYTPEVNQNDFDAILAVV